MSVDDTTRLLLQAYVDGELDAAASLAMEGRLASDPRLEDEHRRLLALRNVVRDKLPRDEAPKALRDAVLAMAQAPAEQPRMVPRRPPFRAAPFAMAAMLLVGIGLGSGVTYLARLGTLPTATEAADDAVVAGHVRALATGTPFDVASTDRHTVKPWFAGKLTFAPQVADFAPEGFVLAGGRVDVVGGRLAATLVYRHGKHVLSLTQMPAAGERPHEPTLTEAAGFSVVQWTVGGSTFWIVSDAAPQEDLALAALFRRKAIDNR